MKKHGFTLAEVLITLGIIGVVSALVIPTFTAQTQNAKIGPRVGKAIASFEQATKSLIEDAGTDNMSDVSLNIGTTTYNLISGTGPNTNSFIQVLALHLKGDANATTGATSFTTKDGVEYCVITGGTIATANPAHYQNQYIRKLRIDLNGTEEPNKDARDRFYFAVMEDGSLLPFGSTGTTYTGLTDARTHKWNEAGNYGCRADEKPTTNGALYCAGNVVENGMKATYK